MAKRPRYSRWRRLPEVFRTGEHKFPETVPEVQRVTVHLPLDVFETLETLVTKLEKPSVREYCAELLTKAIEGERLLHNVEEFEAKHGPLEGLAEIAEDPEYLSEWEAQSRGKLGVHSEGSASLASPEHYVSFRAEDSGTLSSEPIEPLIPEILSEPPQDDRERTSPEVESSERSISWSVEPVVTSIREIRMRDSLVESPTEIILRHAGLGATAGGDVQWSFLPSLRRGEAAPASMTDELLEALTRLEADNREATVIDRKIAHALHRLAFEAQVLLTEAWPGAFDERTVLAIRAVQESVERNLSGQDIRYYSAEPQPVPAASESSR